jgi:hypothetical protein
MISPCYIKMNIIDFHFCAHFLSSPTQGYSSFLGKSDQQFTSMKSLVDEMHYLKTVNSLVRKESVLSGYLGQNQ